MKINRSIINIVSDNLDKSKEFYQTLFDFEVVYDSDWFVNLKNDAGLEIGLIDKTSDIIPAQANSEFGGFYLTFTVESADKIEMLAKDNDYKIIKTATDTFYGMRRLILEDPSGTTIDVSSKIENFQGMN